MNRLTKNCLIIGIICLVLGGVIGTTAMAMGAREAYNEYAYGDPGTKYEINETYENIKSINLQIDVSRVIIREGETFSIQGTTYGRRFNSKVENGVWTVKEEYKSSTNTWNGVQWFTLDFLNWGTLDYYDNEVVITIPSNTNLKSLKVEIDLGSVELQASSLSVDSLDMSVSSGEVNASGVNVTGKTKAEVDLGTIYLTDFSIADDVDLDCSSGHIMLTGTVNGKLKASCDMGSIECTVDGTGDRDMKCSLGYITFNGKIEGDVKASTDSGSIDMLLENAKSDFSYDLDCDLGSITLGDSDYSGIENSISFNEGNKYKMDVKCSIGNITIDFQNE